MADQAEVQRTVTDLSWLDACRCAQLPLSSFFVAAGQTIAPEVLAVCRACPTRRQEVIYAYARGIRHGYFGGLSPAQRAGLSLDEALALVEAERAADDRELGSRPSPER